MNINKIGTLFLAANLPIVCVGDNPDFETVEGGALYLLRSGVETHRGEFDIAEDCEHVAAIMNEAEPAVRWYCSTSVPDIVMNCEISGFALDPGAETETSVQVPESLEFSLVLNRGVAQGASDLGVPISFDYTESDSGYLLTSDYPFASENYFTRAVYLLIIDSATGVVQVRDMGGGENGNGECAPSE